jgi:hypothetical protein
MNVSPPLMLLFGSDRLSLIERCRVELSDNAQGLSGTENEMGYHGTAFLFESIQFDVQIVEHCEFASKLSRVFTGFDPGIARSALTIAFGQHVPGGNAIPPIAAVMLRLGALFIDKLQPSAVLWAPANILSDPEYFAEAVSDYGNGGAFPVLPTVDFMFNASDNMLQTNGLAWFAGQELELHGAHLGKNDVMHRAVRIVHDIATNGPVTKLERVADLDPRNVMELIPSDSGNRVIAKIHSNMNIV